MSLVNLDIDADQLHSVIDALAATERQAQQALNSTLPKIAAWMRGKSVKGLAGVTNVPQKVIRRRLKTFRLSKSASGSSITLWYGLDPVGMIYLNAKQGSGGVRAYGGRFVKSGFIATPSNGKRQVFKRRGTARLPIDACWSPTWCKRILMRLASSASSSTRTCTASARLERRRGSCAQRAKCTTWNGFFTT